MEFSLWLREQEDVIAALQPESVITVYHGSTMQNAYEFCEGGIDARKPVHGRVYANHLSNGKGLKFGMFVAPKLMVAFKFGSYVVEFKARGKDLIHQFPHSMRASDDFYRSKYPGSFRPSVSDNLLNQPIEPQALFIGLVSPREIVAVHALRDNKLNNVYSMHPAEFLEISQQPQQRIRKIYPSFSPTDYKMSLDDFAIRLAQVNRDTPENIMQTLEWIYRKSGHLTGIGDIPHSLLRRIERQLATYIASKDRQPVPPIV